MLEVKLGLGKVRSFRELFHCLQAEKPGEPQGLGAERDTEWKEHTWGGVQGGSAHYLQGRHPLQRGALVGDPHIRGKLSLLR